VTYAYDTATNGKGHLASVSSSVSSYSYSGYDAVGKVMGGSQTIYGSTNQTYKLATLTIWWTRCVDDLSVRPRVNYNYDMREDWRTRTSYHLAFIGYLGDNTCGLIHAELSTMPAPDG